MSWLLSCTAACACSLLFAVSGRGDEAKKDPLQGTWKVISCLSFGGKSPELVGETWRIEDGRFTGGGVLAVPDKVDIDLGAATGDLKPVIETTYRLDATTRPPSIDILLTMGVSKDDLVKTADSADAPDSLVLPTGFTQVYKGVYVLDGNTLRVCLNLSPEMRQNLMQLKTGLSRELTLGPRTTRPRRFSSTARNGATLVVLERAEK